MKPALLRLELRLHRTAIIVLGLSLFAFQFLAIALYVSFASPEHEQLFAGMLKLIPRPIRTLMGGEFVDLLSLQGFLAFCFTHPLPLILLCWGSVAVTSQAATQGASGGITDLLLSQPFSRSSLVLSRAAAGWAAGLFLAGSFWLGHWAGTRLLEVPPPPAELPYLYTGLNAFALFLAVEGLGLLVAHACTRRTTAVGILAGILSAMLFLKIAAALWSAAKIPAALSFFTYYEPGRVVLESGLPWIDLAVLLAFHLGLTAAALVVFQRRDI